MIRLTIKGVVVTLNKNETRELRRIWEILTPADHCKADAQLNVDIWISSSPDEKSKRRRRAAVIALGLVA